MSRASPSCAHTCSSSSSASRRSAGSRCPQSTSRSTARRQPPSSDTSASSSGAGRTKPAIAARDAASIARLREELGDPPTIVVPELDDDVHDVEGLAAVRAHLFPDAA